ncbi:MAG: type II toxin-antitoxin system Phd/YefM family antitoxin [Methanomicrobiales archaeon]|jgi:PHD/YefM family antitoxin component YafN of YafNO toxin-antitoxin module|nr:type II toxin-antitoxin system Phd/YefM family antitoxin [Methanomicrobiales archaeon]
MVPAPHIKVRRLQQLSATEEQYVVDEHGNRVAVILPLREYEQLQEDLHDLAVVAERREEPTIGFDDLKKRYRD